MAGVTIQEHAPLAYNKNAFFIMWEGPVGKVTEADVRAYVTKELFSIGAVAPQAKVPDVATPCRSLDSTTRICTYKVYVLQLDESD